MRFTKKMPLTGRMHVRSYKVQVGGINILNLPSRSQAQMYPEFS